ncbi:MAG: hypothetical protein KDA60_00345 [Planctomycetales bacterium]|nr:hypothetical protein [Planctomycetales bacterium]
MIEILIALAILVGSMAAFAQLSSLAVRDLQRATDLTMQQTLADSKLNELLLGDEPLADSEWMPFLHEPEWSYAIQVMPTEWPSLVAVHVHVAQTPELESPSATINTIANFAGNPTTQLDQRPRQFTLVRWMAASDFSLDGTTSDSPSAAPVSAFERQPPNFPLPRGLP